MKSSKAKQSFYIVITLCVLLWATLAISFFLSKLTKIETESIENSLSATADSNAAQVRSVFERQINTLKDVALALEHFDSFHAPEAMDYLKHVTEIEGYARLAVDYASGTTYTSDGYVLDISPLGYLDKIKQGEPFIRDVTRALVDDQPVVTMFVPLHDKEGNAIASLRGCFTTQQMTELFNQTFFHAKGFYLLVDDSGAYVANGKSSEALLSDETFSKLIERLDYEDGFSADQIQQAFTQGSTGFTKYSLDGESRYAYYLPVGVNNWVLLMVLPKAVVEHTSDLHKQNSMILTAQVIVIFLLTLVYVYFDQVKAKNAALLHEKCIKTLAEQTGKVILEWDLYENSISCLSNFKAIFGRDIVTKNRAEDALQFKNVHEDDRDAFEGIFNTILSGNSVRNVRFRILNSEGKYCWCELSGLVIYDQHNRPFKAIGSLENIESQVQKEQELRQQAEKDLLTGLYNKSTTELLIKNCLQKRDSLHDFYALMIIDVDNFKNINDRFGHLYGDILLSSLADSLKHIFRSDDIIGRIGGDEFFVFLKRFHSMDLLYAKASEICQRFCNTHSENGVSVQISASIGIAICPLHGDDFDTLYKHTDIALYKAKANGKDTYFVFDGDERLDYQSSRTAIDTQGVQKSFSDNRIEYIFKLLYESEEPISSIDSTLKLISYHFNFTHSYIFEFDHARNRACSTFEWHKLDSPERSALMRQVPLTECGYILDILKKADSLIVSDMKDLPDSLNRERLGLTDVHSMMQFSIHDQGELIGSIRFDDCNQTHKLSSDELDEIATICHILSTFLVKQRGKDREKQHHEAIETIIDNIDHYAYVIDQETHEVLYENKLVTELTGVNSIGQSCHMAYRGDSKPCRDCPMLQLSNECTRCSTEMANDKFGLILRVGSAWIDWGNGRTVCLMSCVDVTEYKKNKFIDQEDGTV